MLRPEAVEALHPSDLIIHAGDVGGPSVLTGLRAIAPTFAVRGNVDTAPWARSLPATEVVEAGGLHLYVLHDLAELDLDPAAAGFSAVITGHSHRAAAEVRRGVLFLNPGSAGPRRFRLPVTAARLRVENGRLTHEIVELAV
ncbi:MAG TPA: metallophosphoesterase family protein, partial [Vicinamibacterales bacterium]|nr:metallophosphoesterase family protein [Vicinamibacterales bacterium]